MDIGGYVEMKKTLIVSLALMMLLPAALFAASDWYDMSLGATVQWQPVPKYSDWESAKKDLLKIDNWSFGVDFRNRVALFEVDLVGMYNYSKPLDVPTHTVSVLGTAGLVFDIYDVVRLGIGLGPSFDFIIQDGKLRVLDTAGALVDAQNLGASFSHAPLTYRLTADFLLGSIMIGANYTLPSAWSFAEPTWKGLLPPEWGKGKLGVSILYTIL